MKVLFIRERGKGRGKGISNLSISLTRREGKYVLYSAAEFKWRRAFRVFFYLDSSL